MAWNGDGAESYGTERRRERLRRNGGECVGERRRLVSAGTGRNREERGNGDTIKTQYMTSGPVIFLNAG